MPSTTPASARAARSRRAHVPSGAEPACAPAPAATSFLGRENEISELSQLSKRERLVTLTGAPGIGKSRLALVIASQLADGYREGVGAVELASITRPADVARAVASELSIDEVAGQDLLDTVAARLSRRRMLLVLDNCEHLLGPCAELVSTLLQRCPELTVLATSREALSIAEEMVWHVAPLAVPPAENETSAETLMTYPAVALFAARAAAIQPGFSLTAYTAPAVAQIARRLDGIPLAIELAAARVESLTPEEIVRRLDDGVALLSRGAPSDLARHQTLQGALDWSHELLSEPERVLLRRLSVFVGGFQLAAAEAVCAGGALGHEQVADSLAGLVGKSLVLAEAGSSAEGRYRLLETIRAYAEERLEDAGETAARRTAHGGFYLELAQRAEPQLTGADQARWLDRLELERANLVVALEWSLAHGNTELVLRLAGALVLFWRVRCHFSEGRELLEAAVSAGDGASADLRAKAHWGAGFMASMMGDVDAAIPHLEESLARYRELRDPQGCARTLLILGSCRQLLGDWSGLSLLEESAALAREAGDPWCLAHALGVAGFDRGSRNELPAARVLLEEAVRVARQAEDKQGMRYGLIGLGMVCLRQGDHPVAKLRLEEALTITDELGEVLGKAVALESLGEWSLARGDYGRAGALLDEALALMREVGAPGPSPLALRARVAHAEDDWRGARRLFEEALTAAGPGNDFAIPALQGLGELLAHDGEAGEARRLFEAALELARSSSDKGAQADALHGLGRLARAAGDVKRAAALCYEALELRREIGGLPGLVASLEAVAGLDLTCGGYEHAARLFGAAQALREENGWARGAWESALHASDVAGEREGLSGKGYEVAFGDGARLSLEEAVAEALKHRRRRGRASDGWSSLTDSEQRVATLVAEGLSNPQIAERLVISLATVKFHLSNCFSKLGVTGRTELARALWDRSQQRPSPEG